MDSVCANPGAKGYAHGAGGIGGAMRAATRRTLLSKAGAAAAAAYPLDGISNIVGAYDFRRLFSSYTGNAALVRRSSDDAELAIGFDASGNFDVSAFGAHVGGGSGYVKTWYDQSETGNDVTQATAEKQPQIILNAVNTDKTAARYSAHVLGCTFTSSPGAGNYTEFVVAMSNNVAAGFRATAAFSGELLTLYMSAAAFYPYISGGYQTGQTKSQGAWFTESITRATTTSQHYLDGVPAGGTKAHSQNLLTSFWIGGATATAYPFDGDIAMVIVMGETISTANHNTIGESVDSYYGISWTTVT